MGISHSWNGTVLTITSDSGTSSADLKGEMGIRGPQGIPGEQFKPEKGVDYFTPTEIADVTEEIKNSLTPYIDTEVEAASNELTGYVDQKAQEVNSSLTSYVDTEVNEAKEYVNANFAPSGYGLGGDCRYLDNWENATKNGFYYSYSGLPNGYEGMTFQGYAINYNGYIILDIWQTGAGFDNVHLFRKYNANTQAWGEWEFVNPPMIPGVEYRTTERWNGKAVYRKLITYTTNGTVGNTSSIVDINIPHGISNLDFLLSGTGTNGANLIPNISANYGGSIVNKHNAGSIIWRLNKDTWSGTIYFELRYTKK
jgi:hypothetical protein